SIIYHGSQPDRSGDHHQGGRALRIIWGTSVYGQPVATNRSADRIGIGPGCCGGRPCWDSTSACFNLTNLVFGGPWGRCMFWCSGRRERSTCRCPRLCHSCRVCVFCYRHRCPPGAFGGNPSVVAPPSARRCAQESVVDVAGRVAGGYVCYRRRFFFSADRFCCNRHCYPDRNSCRLISRGSFWSVIGTKKTSPTTAGRRTGFHGCRGGYYPRP